MYSLEDEHDELLERELSPRLHRFVESFYLRRPRKFSEAKIDRIKSLDEEEREHIKRHTRAMLQTKLAITLPRREEERGARIEYARRKAAKGKLVHEFDRYGRQHLRDPRTGKFVRIF